jgi:hypothetical protein
MGNPPGLSRIADIRQIGVEPAPIYLDTNLG